LFAQTFERTVELVTHAIDGKIDSWRNVEIPGHDLLEHYTSETFVRGR
jgi:hypothetical protein